MFIREFPGSPHVPEARARIRTPVDYDPPAVDDLVERRGGYQVVRVLRAVESQGAGVRVLIFDACRNTPVVTSKSDRVGLRQVEGKPEGTFIAFASWYNQVAREEPGQRNSVYTGELLRALALANPQGRPEGAARGCQNPREPAHQRRADAISVWLPERARLPVGQRHNSRRVRRLPVAGG